MQIKQWWIFLGLLSLLLITEITFAQATITLQGVVVQGTADGAALTGRLPIRLQILDSNGSVVETFSVNTDDDFNFTFENILEYEADHFYVLSTFWANIEQTNLPLHFADLTETLEFPVYETTETIDNIVLHGGNLRVEFSGVTQLGLEMLLEANYINLGDRIVMPGDDGIVATIELPVGAFNVAPIFSGVARYQVEDNLNGLHIPAVHDTQPIIPNWSNTLTVSFIVPYEDGALIDMRFPFAVNNLDVAVREDTVGLQSDLLQLVDEKETTSGKTYWVYQQIEPLNPAEPFKFTLIGAPTETVSIRTNSSSDVKSDSGSGLLLIVIIMGAVLVFSLLMVWLVWARQESKRESQ